MSLQIHPDGYPLLVTQKVRCFTMMSSDGYELGAPYMHVIGLGASMHKASVQASVIQVLNIIFSHLVSILIRSSGDHPGPNIFLALVFKSSV